MSGLLVALVLSTADVTLVPAERPEPSISHTLKAGYALAGIGNTLALSGAVLLISFLAPSINCTGRCGHGGMVAIGAAPMIAIGFVLSVVGIPFVASGLTKRIREIVGPLPD